MFVFTEGGSSGPGTLRSLLRCLAGALWVAACLAASLASPGAARAQGAARAPDDDLVPLQTDDFSALRFYQAPGTGNFFMVDGSDTTPDLTPQLGVTLNYENQPFVADELDCVNQVVRPNPDPTILARCESEQREINETPLLEHALTLQIVGAFTVGERVQIGLNVPVVLYFQGNNFELLEQPDPTMPSITRNVGQDTSGAGLGDPRLHVKVRILDPEGTPSFGLAVAAWVHAPLGQAIQGGDPTFLGDELPEFGGHLIGGFQVAGFRLSLNAGAAYRESARNARSAVGPEFRWGAAGAYRINPLLEAIVEGTGAVSFDGHFDTEAPTELRAGAQLYVDDLSFHLAGGVGLFYGVGVPIFRVVGGASWSPRAQADSDRDGVPDGLDGCPTEAEDMDGFADEDGCPDVDNDDDEIPDSVDQCPDRAEDEPGEGADGCPDDDDDDDGISDGYDSCPNDPEDMDGDRDNDGCPDYDTDQDGLDDERDQCPEEAEDFDAYEDEDGCPEPDNDGDGLLDEEDACPEEAEDMDGYQDGDGCPERGTGRRRGRRRR